MEDIQDKFGRLSESMRSSFMWRYIEESELTSDFYDWLKLQYGEGDDTHTDDYNSDTLRNYVFCL